jgi:hypothetical protein
VDSKFRDSSNSSVFLNITLPQPYHKEYIPTINELGLPIKPYYFTQDVCRVLKIKPDTFRGRTYRGYYPEYQKIGVKRIFTIEQIKELIRISKELSRR